MATSTSDENRAAAAADALAASPGVTAVDVDGRRMSIDRQAAMAEVAFWERRAARASGRRPAIVPIDLGSAW